MLSQGCRLIPHRMLLNHTEGHDWTIGGSEKEAGWRFDKDFTGVEEYPNQDKLRKISVRRSDSNPRLPDGRPRCEPDNHAELLCFKFIFIIKTNSTYNYCFGRGSQNKALKFKMCTLLNSNEQRTEPEPHVFRYWKTHIWLRHLEQIQKTTLWSLSDTWCSCLGKY